MSNLLFSTNGDPVLVPDAGLVAELLGKAENDVVEAWQAELRDQAVRCRVEPYNDALAQALVRRVQRHLAMRALPLGVQVNAEGAGVRIGSTDPEVRRLEAPYRRMPIG